MKLGIVSNRYSDGNAGYSAIAAFAVGKPDVLCAAPESLAALPGVLKYFASQKVDLLAIDGGDGTVRDVLTALPQGFDDPWPAIVLLPSGKTNLIARDVGSFGGGVKGVERLLAALKDPSKTVFVDRHCLEAIWTGDAQKTVRGLFFGAAIFTYATLMAGTWTYGRGIKQNAGVALAMVRALWQSVRGDPNAAGAPLALAPGETLPPGGEKPYFLVLATSLDRLMLGFWPFPKTGHGTLHWLAVQAPPRRLLRALWQAWRGRLHADPARGYEGGRADMLTLRLGAPFVIDGELFDPGTAEVRLHAGVTIRFLSPTTATRITNKNNPV
jgi:hypothetical protein